MKDILTFANGWRRADAYILVGVEERPGQKAEVIGIAAHLNDADVQQLINSKTNSPVEFSYTPTELEGKQIGVFRIPLQSRPKYLLKAFGGLTANTVYIRRGSSTDVAKPDEIARMGASTVEVDKAKLSLSFADASRRVTRPSPLHLDCLLLEMTDSDAIPDYDEEPLRVGGVAYPGGRHVNRDYFRELAEYTKAARLCTPLQFAITNEGGAVARDVRIELVCKGADLVAFDTISWPEIPKKIGTCWTLFTALSIGRREPTSASDRLRIG